MNVTEHLRRLHDFEQCVILEILHIPVRTQKWPPRLIFAGTCHGIVINYVIAINYVIVINYGHCYEQC